MRHYHVINSETGEDYTAGWNEKRQQETAGVRTLAEARAALRAAKESYSGNDVWLLGSMQTGEVRVYAKRWHHRQTDCDELNYDASVSICEGGIAGVECVCDD